MAYTTINKGSSYFNSVLYTGNATTNAITGVGFQPDFVWCKNRPSVLYHGLYDAVRGTGTTKGLSSNSNEAEGVNALYINLTSFNSDGFTLGATVNTNQINKSGENHVSWNWLGANTTVSNTSGTITSTVSANTTSGFSIVSYTGNGTTGATRGHGLGVVPSMIILKSRSATGNWPVYHKNANATPQNGGLYLNATDAFASAAGFWNNTAPTSTVFSTGGGADTNANGTTYVAYCFADVKGYSKFGSYTGNSSADGTFVYTGFKPAFVMVKNTNYGSGTDWYIFDNKRNTYNVENLYLSPNLSAAEATGVETDFLSNGFKLRHSSIAMNNSSYTYIYMAFAENPFVSATAIPTTAR